MEDGTELTIFEMFPHKQISGMVCQEQTTMPMNKKGILTPEYKSKFIKTH